jgi:tetratricopeptide (TPR) repeat protein
VRKVSRPLAALAVVFSTSGAAAGQAARPAVGLPPIACVEAVRVARIARDAGDAAAARTQLDLAVEWPGCELPALAAILPLLRAGVYPPDRAAALRSRLTTRLEDPAVEVPEGLLTHLAGVRGDDELLLGALEKRLARAPAVDPKPPPPGLVELLDVTSELQERQGKSETARETLARLLALQPSEALQWRALPLDLRLARWSSAAELLSTMLDAPDASVMLREQYVRVLAHLGRFDEMTKQIEKLAPPPVPTNVDLPASRYTTLLLDAAWALRDAGRNAEAQATFRRALAHEPDHAETQLALLHLYGTAEDGAAQAAAVQARRAGESNPLALFEEGSDLLGAGDAKGASELLARAAPQLAGTDYAEPAWYNLGSAAFKLERWEEAANAFATAIAVNPGRVESHYKRGIALFHLERCRDAVAALRRTLELQPDKRDAHYYLAGCYTKLGDAAAAARENATFNAKP